MTRLLLASPGLLTLAYLAGSILALSKTPLGTAGGLIALGLQFTWAYALYETFATASQRPGWMLEGRTFFLAAPVGVLLIALADGSPVAALGLALTFASLFTSHWMAGRALVAAEGGEDPYGNRKVVALLALIYFPIGVWFLRRRVAVLLAQPAG